MSAVTGPTVRIAVAGCGIRLRHLLGMVLAPNPRIRLHGLFDPDPLSLAAAQRELGPAARVYADYASLAGDPDVDWVLIGSPNCHHAAQAVAALEAGKHLFCEKPLATTLEDCRRVQAAVARACGIFSFGLVLRYSPHYRAIKSLVAGRLGRVLSFEFNETLRPGHGGYIFGNWRRCTALAGPHILEKCCHDLDLGNWMADSLPRRVMSFGGRSFFTPEHAGLAKELRNPDGSDYFCLWPDPHRVNPFDGGADICDHQVVVLEYANGVRASFHTHAASALPERRFYIHGTCGTLRGDVYSGRIEFRRFGEDAPLEDCSSAASDGHGGGDPVLATGLARSMLDGAPPLAGIREAVESAVVALAVEDARTGGQVVDLASYWDLLRRPDGRTAPAADAD